MKEKQDQTARLGTRNTLKMLPVEKRAAEMQGHSVSDFVVAAAQEARHRTIEEAQIIHLSLEDRRAFAEAVINPPEPAPAFRRSLRRHRKTTKKPR